VLGSGFTATPAVLALSSIASAKACATGVTDAHAGDFRLLPAAVPPTTAESLSRSADPVTAGPVATATSREAAAEPWGAADSAMAARSNRSPHATQRLAAPSRGLLDLRACVSRSLGAEARPAPRSLSCSGPAAGGSAGLSDCGDQPMGSQASPTWPSLLRQRSGTPFRQPLQGLPSAWQR
jgi:hypothetical protein